VVGIETADQGGIHFDLGHVIGSIQHYHFGLEFLPLASVKTLKVIGRHQSAGNSDGPNELLDAEIAADEALEICGAQAVRLEHIREENLGGGNAGALEIGDHVAGNPGHHLWARVNSKLIGLLLEHQPLISLALGIEAHLASILVGPATTAHKEKLQGDVALRMDILLLRNRLPTNGAESDGPPALVHAAHRREKNDEADNGERDNDRPQPRLMLSNRPKHKFTSL
jgi:hypothetical protein